ncbi:tyrosine-type recombinase/integrase [Clostridium polynesiense]|uniref:tyrosine-type recombinase/integrase n=1 Tax=Clostridium polynesiense TaxID=1325933 RepID=UPI00164E294E|nr:tyrosine-type recombinase/integrase [Clostridium polynesiense]
MDKHAAKHNGQSMGIICSFNEKRSLQEVAYQFKDYMKDNYPHIKMLKDVKSDHWQAFLNEKSKTCSTATLKNYVSRIHKIEHLCRNKFRITSNWRNEILTPQSKKTPTGDKLRIQTMGKEDLEKVLDYGYKHCTSKAIPAIELCYRFGLRDAETSRLTVDCVDFDKAQLRVVGKGGRCRYLEIKKDDVKILKTLCVGKINKDKLIEIKADSINQQLNRILKKLNLKNKYPLTGIHAIRKLRAQELWDEKRKQGYTKTILWTTLVIISDTEKDDMIL